MKIIFITLISLPFFLLGEEPVCERCQIVREYNETHPNKYVYYEDYLKDKAEGKAEEHNASEAFQKK